MSKHKAEENCMVLENIPKIILKKHLRKWVYTLEHIMLTLNENKNTFSHRNKHSTSIASESEFR